MGEALRTLLLVALATAALTTAALAFGWWMEAERRLRRALARILANPPQAEAVNAAEGRAAALDFDAGQVAVLCNRGVDGLVYAFDEIEGGEVIVDGHVVARVRRGEARKALDVLAPDADQVVLRLMFTDPRHPEFELGLFTGLQAAAAGTAPEALRLGCRWLSHLEALMR